MRGKESQASPSNCNCSWSIMVPVKSLSVSLSLQELMGFELEMCWLMVEAKLGGTKSETSVMWARSCPLFPDRSFLICPEADFLRFTTVETSTPAFFEH